MNKYFFSVCIFILLTVPLLLTTTLSPAANAPDALAVICGAVDKAEPFTLSVPVILTPELVVSIFYYLRGIVLQLHHI